MNKFVLFDLDGTIMDSGPGIKKCAMKTLEKLNIPHKSYEDMDYFIGPPFRDCFRLSNVEEERVEEACNIYRDLYINGGIYDQKVYPGITKLFYMLLADNYKLMVCTSKGELLAIEVVNHFQLSKYFYEIHGGSMDASRAKKSEIIEDCMKNHEDDEFVMVGDTYLDIEGAKINHINSIGVTYGYGDKTKLKESHPDIIVDDVESIYDAIKKLM